MSPVQQSGLANGILKINSAKRNACSIHYCFGVIVFSIVVPCAIGCVFFNQWANVLRLSVVLLPCALLVWGLFLLLNWLHSSKKVGLLPGRICLNDLEIKFEDIICVEWPIENKQLIVSMKYRVLDSTADQTYLDSFDLTSLSSDFRFLVVQCLEQLDCQHDNWFEFSCCHLRRWLVRTPPEQFSRFSFEVDSEASFGTGFIFAPLIICKTLLTVSKFVYWGIGLAIGLSALINIRIMHGSWLPPTGTIMIGFATALMVIGAAAGIANLLSPKYARPKVSGREKRTSLQAGGLLMFSIVFCPLVMSYLIGMPGAQIVLFVFVFGPIVPFLVQLQNEEKEIRDTPAEVYKSVMEEWRIAKAAMDQLDAGCVEVSRF